VTAGANEDDDVKSDISDSGPQIIKGMISPEGECVEFTEPVDPIGSVENWLNDIEKTMCRSLWEIMGNA